MRSLHTHSLKRHSCTVERALTDGGGDRAFAKSVALEPQHLANLAHG
jgi:hypothetical protein